MNPGSSLSRRIFLQSLALAGASRAVLDAAGLPHLPTVDEELRRAAKAAELRLMFKGHTAAELTTWQKEFSAALRQRLGPHRPPERWSAQLLSQVEFPDHVRGEWLLTAEGAPSLPLYILKP